MGKSRRSTLMLSVDDLDTANCGSEYLNNCMNLLTSGSLRIQHFLFSQRKYITLHGGQRAFSER